MKRSFFWWIIWLRIAGQPFTTSDLLTQTGGPVRLLRQPGHCQILRASLPPGRRSQPAQDHRLRGLRRRQTQAAGQGRRSLNVCRVPAVIEATPWLFSTPGGTFTNSWSCFCLGTRGKFDGQTPFCSDGILQKTSLCLPRHLSDN